MPLDIVFEIASHLAPRDLLALSRTSKALQKMLHSPNTSSVWRVARSNVGAPDCSPGFSEPRWASLLFGRPICKQCDTTNVHNIEFGIRRRVCIRCQKQHLVSAVRFEKVFPHYESLIMDMVPHTLSGGWTRGSRTPGKFFWASDVELIASEWAALQRDIHMYVKGARAAAAAYKKQKIDEAERIAQHAKVCDDWLRYCNMKLQMEADRKREEERKRKADQMREADQKWKRLVQAIQGRLLELGYDIQDIPSTFYVPNSQKGAELTDQLWTCIQLEIVEIVESNRDDRLERERAKLWVERLAILRSLYVEYAKSMAPLQWCYLPNIYELAELSVFRDILEVDSSVDISRQSFLPATDRLSTLVPALISAKKERLISMLELSSSRTADHPLDLATSVFVCTGRNCTNRALISWEAIAAHNCYGIATRLHASYDSVTLGVSQLGASTASALVRLANLDPSSATITEMDALDLRFACFQCALTPGCRSITIYPWKSAVCIVYFLY
ncbi:hypothetical protein BD779DRAFT_1170672 [Infundibulicybe gibba]|nr:hypothetical protein BD779DRAFT_1170672 [Infundibulicybe gibba]